MNVSATVSAAFAPGVPLAVLLISCAAAFAQALPASGDYTKDLPSVQRVEAEIKGSDLTDTLAREVAVFGHRP